MTLRYRAESGYSDAMSDALTITRPDFEAADNAKRRQILEGARAVFLAQG